MKIQDLCLYDWINNKPFVKEMSKYPSTVCLTNHSKILWSSFLYSNDMLNFHITDSTKERIKNVPVEDINGEKIIGLQNKPSKGIVYFSNGLHFIYLIRNNGVYILTSSKTKTKFSNNPSFVVGNTTSGFLYFDFFSKHKEQYINNPLDALHNKNNLLNKEPHVLNFLMSLTKKNKIESQRIYENLQKDYTYRYEETKLCLQAFMFIHFAKVINTTKISQTVDNRTLSEKIKKKAIKNDINIIQVDTTYDKNIHVINPFSVQGHFRNQPFGIGRKETKLIYIDDFMKTGYHRTATKNKINI
jgi:hypothetical protein